MIKKLKKVGNSQALIIDKSILELLHINKETDLEISTNGDVLLIKPIRDKNTKEKFKQTLDWINQEYGEVLIKLAN